jgi:hypothetical protein
MQKITINGYGFEYIRGYIEDAENIPVEELLEGDGISVTSITCNYNAYGFGQSYSKFYNDTTKSFIDLDDNLPIFYGMSFNEYAGVFKEQKFLEDLVWEEKGTHYNYELFISGKGSLGEFNIDDDVKLENIILVTFYDAYEINDNIGNLILIGVIPYIDTDEKNIFISAYENRDDPESFIPAESGRYKGMSCNEVFSIVHSKYIPIDYLDTNIAGSIDRL